MIVTEAKFRFRHLNCIFLVRAYFSIDAFTHVLTISDTQLFPHFFHQQLELAAFPVRAFNLILNTAEKQIKFNLILNTVWKQ